MKAQNRTLVQSNTQQRRSSQRQQRGNGLLYAMLGSALLAMGSYYAYGIYSDKTNDSLLQAEITNAQDVISHLQSIYVLAPNGFTGITAANVQPNLPARMKASSTALATTASNQTLTFAVVSATQLDIGWPVPKGSCADFAMAMSRVSLGVKIGTAAAVLKDTATGTVDPSQLVTGCTGTTPVVTFSVGRQGS